MTTQAGNLLTEALSLSDVDRAMVAEGILATLDDEAADPSDDELEAELDRRLEEYRRDPTTSIPWSVLKNES